MIKLLIVDDDAFTRIFLRNLAELNPEIQVVGEAVDGLEAVSMVKQLKPDVITMDVMMPGMDGLEATRLIMATNPCPIIMVSELTQADSDATVKALGLGAVDFLSKSSSHLKFDIPHVKKKLVDLVLYWAKNKPGGKKASFHPKAVTPSGPVEIILITASTGGPQILPDVLQAMGRTSCPVVLAQVMPEIFTNPFVSQLAEKTVMEMVVATANMPLRPGVIHVAPGGMDTIIRKDANGRLRLEVALLPGNTAHPSSNALLESAAQTIRQGVAVILTGKSENIANGAKKVFNLGWPVLVQTPSSCVADQLPKAVLEAGAATEILSPKEIGSRLAQFGR